MTKLATIPCALLCVWCMATQAHGDTIDGGSQLLEKHWRGTYLDGDDQTEFELTFEADEVSEGRAYLSTRHGTTFNCFSGEFELYKTDHDRTLSLILKLPRKYTAQSPDSTTLRWRIDKVYDGQRVAAMCEIHLRQTMTISSPLKLSIVELVPLSKSGSLRRDYGSVGDQIKSAIRGEDSRAYEPSPYGFPDSGTVISLRAVSDNSSLYSDGAALPPILPEDRYEITRRSAPVTLRPAQVSSSQREAVQIPPSTRPPAPQKKRANYESLYQKVHIQNAAEKSPIMMSGDDAQIVFYEGDEENAIKMIPFAARIELYIHPNERNNQFSRRAIAVWNQLHGSSFRFSSQRTNASAIKRLRTGNLESYSIHLKPVSDWKPPKWSPKSGGFF